MHSVFVEVQMILVALQTVHSPSSVSSFVVMDENSCRGPINKLALFIGIGVPLRHDLEKQAAPYGPALALGLGSHGGQALLTRVYLLGPP